MKKITKKLYNIKLSIEIDPKSTLDMKQIVPSILGELYEYVMNTNTDDEVQTRIVDIRGIKQ